MMQSKDGIIFLVLCTGDSLFSYQAQARINQRILGASKHADHNSMQNRAFILFLLGTGYR